MSNLSSSHAVIFIEGRYNRYSLAVLTGALEADARLRETDLLFVKSPSAKHATGRAADALAAQLVSLVQRYRKVVVACSFHTANVIEIGGVLARLRDRLTESQRADVLCVAGGSHPSGDPVGTVELGFDVVIVGEGEVTFPHLLARYFADQPYTDLPGLGVRDPDGTVRLTGRADFVDLSDFPPFAFHNRRFCPIEISRGCPCGCQFCQTSFFMGGRMRHRSLDSIVHYAEQGRSIGLRIMRFISPSALAYQSPDGHAVNLGALETLLKAMAEMYGREQTFFGSFPSELRPEHISPESLSLIRRYCANQNLVIGAQSGSERLLQAIQRGHGVAEVVRAVELACQAGFTPSVDFIFGLPGETPQDREQTLSLIDRLTRLGARIHGHTFMPLAGTPFAHCPPGVIDPALRELLNQLQGRRMMHGRWRQQERMARATTEFLAGQAPPKGR